MLQRTRVGDASARDSEHGATRRTSTGQRLAHELPDKASTIFIGCHAACRNSTTYVGLKQSVNGGGRHAAHHLSHVGWPVGATIAVKKLREKQDDRVRGLRCDPCQQFWQGQTGYEFHIGCSCPGRR